MRERKGSISAFPQEVKQCCTDVLSWMGEKGPSALKDISGCDSEILGMIADKYVNEMDGGKGLPQALSLLLESKDGGIPLYEYTMIAAKEMYLGRYYLEKEKWIAAMNRFKNVVENYDKTIYIEEALFRLVEIHYKLGMIDESKKFAKLLGYNYQSSEWYLASYKIFNKDYKKIKKIEKSTKVSLVDKLKSLID